jgi:hypothetical protein
MYDIHEPNHPLRYTLIVSGCGWPFCFFHIRPTGVASNLLTEDFHKFTKKVFRNLRIVKLEPRVSQPRAICEAHGDLNPI